MAVKIGINGFGRIGRNLLRAMLSNPGDVELVAVNDLLPRATQTHLLQYDSIFGTLPQEVSSTDDGIRVGDLSFKVLNERNPKELPWGDLGVDVVVESTGIFSSRDDASAHLDGGAKVVVVSQPSKGADATFVYGVNHDTFDPSAHRVVSNASCTTNCLVPMVKVLDDAFGVERGLMTTVHAYTGTQAIVDGGARDPGLREQRAAAVNVVPSETGAARATSLVLKSMEGKLDGGALRVPVPDGSFTDLTAVLAKEVGVDEINAAYESAAKGEMAGILRYSTAPIVSSDIVGDPSSCVFDAPLTKAIGTLVKVGGWYDNEWGYSNRLKELVEHIGRRLAG